MKELMLHVEKIVRPLPAFQWRKLSMRREMLTHLQSAFDEERAAGREEAEAIKVAKQRLGDPAHLTKSLQQSIPSTERILFGNVPAPESFHRLDKRVGGSLHLHQRLTMAHAAILVLTATAVGYVSLVYAMRVLSPWTVIAAQFESRSAFLSLNAFALFAALSTMWASLRFTGAASMTTSPRRNAQLAHLAAFLFVMPIAMLVAIVVVIARRAPAPAEMTRGIIIATSLLAILFATGRLVAHLRRKYDEWLTLELA